MIVLSLTTQHCQSVLYTSSESRNDEICNQCDISTQVSFGVEREAEDEQEHINGDLHLVEHGTIMVSKLKIVFSLRVY